MRDRNPTKSGNKLPQPSDLTGESNKHAETFECSAIDRVNLLDIGNDVNDIYGKHVSEPKNSTIGYKTQEITRERDLHKSQEITRLCSRLSSFFSEKLWSYLISCDRKDRELFSLSMTFPKSADLALQAAAPHWFSLSIVEKDDDGGVWLVGDLESRFHLHGLALTVLPKGELLALWCDLTHGSPYAQKLTRVSGQGAPWTTDNHTLQRNLSNVIDYPIGKYPAANDVFSRTFATGVLRPLWASSYQRVVNLGGTDLSTSEASHRSDKVSICDYCQRQIPHGKRRDARYCSSSHRQAMYRQKKERKKKRIGSEP